ncbi:phage distal tail protein domain-containing protein, partial [Oenococcus oeni]
MIGSMFQLTNAQGKTVDIQSNTLRAYTPIGLGLYMTNTYSVYNSSFIRTNSQLTDPTSNPYEVYIQFGDISSQSYQTFADFASFLAYPPYT